MRRFLTVFAVVVAAICVLVLVRYYTREEVRISDADEIRKRLAGKPKPTTKLSDTGQISFTVLFETSRNNGIAAAYTDDPDSLWARSEWVGAVRKQMKDLADEYETVLLFDSREHTPAVQKLGMEYPQHYDQWMVAGYWKYPTGVTRFSYGGTDADGNFRYTD